MLSVLLTLLLLASPSADEPEPRTEIVDAAAAKQLLGTHKMRLQWITWTEAKDFGEAKVTDDGGTYRVKGSQQKNGDYVLVDGIVLSVHPKEFAFRGTIVTRVSYINNGDPCERKGDFTFAITKGRIFWRMQQMDNPCDQATDYVDIFLRQPAKKK